LVKKQLTPDKEDMNKKKTPEGAYKEMIKSCLDYSDITDTVQRP
jgi:hypothetical protein